MGQFVESDEIVPLPLVVGAVLGAVHRAKIDLGAGRKCPAVVVAVIFCPRIGPFVYLHGAIDQLRELREGLTQKQPRIIRDMYLSQCLRQQSVALAASGSAAV